MNHRQRVNAYCDLIRFLGVLYADLMRVMLRAEEIADEEALLQVNKEAATPTIAPRLVTRMEKEENTSHLNDAGSYDKAEAEVTEE